MNTGHSIVHSLHLHLNCIGPFYPCSFKISSAVFGEVTVGVQGVCSCDCEMDRVSLYSTACSETLHTPQSRVHAVGKYLPLLLFNRW